VADVITTIEQDAEKVVAELSAAWTTFKTEGEKLIAWVDGNIPGAKAALAQFVTTAEADAATIAKLAAAGFQDVISSHADQIETMIANLLQVVGVDLSKPLSEAEVAAINTLKTIMQSGASAALAVVLGKLAPAPAAPAA
jgi:hypothetical protein